MMGNWPAYLLILAIWTGCASVPETKLLPIMGLNEPEEEETGAASDSVAQVAGGDSTSALAQAFLLLPFEDSFNYRGSWNIHAEIPRALADSLRRNAFFRPLPVDSVLARLDGKEQLRGRVPFDRALALARAFGADYLIFGEIEELSMKRFRATVPVGGYRSYQGVTSVTLRLVKVIDEQPAGQLVREGVEDSKLYGVTNPAASVPYDRQYFLLDQMAWNSDEFRESLVGKSVGKCLAGLAAALDSLIRPPPELRISEPKIIDIDGAQAYIKVGLVDSVRNGDKFGVWDGGRVLTDPQTGTVLGRALPRRIGVVQVEQVLSEHLSLVRILEGEAEMRREYSIRAE